MNSLAFTFIAEASSCQTNGEIDSERKRKRRREREREREREKEMYWSWNVWNVDRFCPEVGSIFNVPLVNRMASTYIKDCYLFLARTPKMSFQSSYRANGPFEDLPEGYSATKYLYPEHLDIR